MAIWNITIQWLKFRCGASHSSLGAMNVTQGVFWRDEVTFSYICAIKISLSSNKSKTNKTIIEYLCIKWTRPHRIFPCRLLPDPLTQPFIKACWRHQSSFLMQNDWFLWPSRIHLYLKEPNKSNRGKLPFIYLPASSLPFYLLLHC